MPLPTLVASLVAPSVASLVWFFILRRSVARAYERGRASVDNSTDYWDGYNTGYSKGWAASERWHTDPELRGLVDQVRDVFPKFFAAVTKK
jgi:hypothetical protein